MEHLDPYQRPPESIKDVYKKYQKMRPKNLERDLDIVDLPDSLNTSAKDKVRIVEEWSGHDLTAAFWAFSGQDAQAYADLPPKIPVYEHADMPGLHIVPNLLPPTIQSLLLSRLLHRDLSNPAHLTNIHTHYNLSYPNASASDSSPGSFFTYPPTSADPIATPLDPSVHKPLTVPKLLRKKMRWTTLGGQYDWTAKEYPPTNPPPFPADIKTLLESIWTSTKAEAAIVNLYSPGDTLSVHRDVAETSGTGLVSVSLGCDAVFVIGVSTSTSDWKESGEKEVGEKTVTLRLRSGSALYMSGPSRFAWHGVPQIVKGTCPQYLADWPAEDGKEEFKEWRGWMSGKRVNLNVRQMWD
ncbi:oxidoreductase [Didymella exigua CBS 183.55]|uniref:mRNA N(6)-methyladenine demethylase n=1 Tax=Didymella exigua CBS 183.55 TaxID=1150837 RepID=A0A6A5RK18_9PLEO|nr:oxidoreductase [Didymella exigua CBS 183.55]KAF1925897.1 oxidoreductase [Didymella exigua CBS 183.55]